MIPVFDPVIGEEEIAAVTDALRKGEISGSFGSYIPKFEKEFAKYVGAKHGIAVSNGTTALHLAVDAAGIKAGDEVLVSASTNIATALAAYHNNAVAVAVDSENETWNLNLDLIEGLITPKTKAIIPVHLFGHPVDMDKLLAIAKKHNLIVIEDCAESHGATVRGKMTGSFGDMGCYSFYANKIITTGEGGMIVTDNDAYAEKLRLLRNLAFTTPRFWHEVAGYNFRMTGYQAAMGVAQLNKIEDFIDGKRRMAAAYGKHLADVTELQLPVELSWAKNVYWMYGVSIKNGTAALRNELMDYLKANGVDTRTFFCPMNIQPFLMNQPGHRKVECPVAESIWETGLYLPSSVNLKEEDIAYVSSQIKNFFAGKK
ncbi:MAG TPA: DegT/DnrJ/EryC1/StrS family aminotransferase [Chitinophagales bacterium]|nr:DegT/DnrJ/EryC1/StrS family aminotransferase [Chitinophagales bacterium]